MKATLTNLITFEYYIELEKGFGFKPVGETREETEVVIQIKAKNRVTADRMLHSIIDNTIITNIYGVALD